MQYAGIDEALVLYATALNQLGAEQVNPLRVGRVGDLPFISTVAAKELSIGGNIEMDGPLVDRTGESCRFLSVLAGFLH